jgi:carboxyl-terminal processing protease
MSRRSLSKPLWIVAAVACCAAATLALAAGIQRSEAYRYLKVFQEVWSLTEASYVEPVEEGDLLEGAYRGMLSSVDAASGYLSSEDVATLEEPLGPAGAGMELLPSGGTFVVVRVDPAGPAAAAGLERGDQVWKVEDRGVRDVPWPVVRRWLRGSAGQELELTVLDGRHFKLRDVTLTLAAPSGPGFRLENHGEVVRLRILDLEQLAPDRLRQALTEAASQGSSVLIDLRGVVSLDPDGLTRLAGVLLPGGRLLELKDASGRTRAVEAAGTQNPVLPQKQSFVLIDSSTAGMAEALAALLRERMDARVCGRSSFGLAGIPSRITLSSGAEVLLTTQLVQLPGAGSWAEEGLEPDHELSASRAADDDADPMLDAALEWIRSGASTEEAAEAA